MNKTTTYYFETTKKLPVAMTFDQVQTLVAELGIPPKLPKSGWSFKNFFRDLIFEISKVFLHDIGFYKKNNCACHEMVQGKRMKRG